MNDLEKTIDVEQLIREKNPTLLKYLPKFILRYLKRILHEDDINEFIALHKDHSPIDFCNAVMDKFNIQIDYKGMEYIPKSGGAIMAMNHPWGGMDAIALVTVVHNKREDLKFIVNDILMHVKNLNPLFVGVNKLGKSSKESLKSVEDAFSGGDLLCIFPAGLVSRKIKGKVTDLEWKKTFVTRAKKYDKQIIPTYIDGRLSNFFYNIYTIRKRLGIKANIEMLYLVNELYKQHNKKITIRFGKPIQSSLLDSSQNDQYWAQFVKKKVYELKE